MGVMSLGKSRSGTKEWVFQRLSNVAICLWGVIFIGLVLTLDSATFSDWKGLFSPTWFKVYSSITLVMVCLNSVLAGWQIGTDYIKPTCVNRFYMVAVKLVSLAYVAFGLYILWIVS
ncbi:succinate dehydrogenase, hydrophobic membrane anchor protein [Marinomonas colpomeniae]|uniref:Succinate dehydrogenase hydrophobic membrane anchor subunit n=1 Tax=Marinomonas colpomeniae TaxID=2774408 RepID=A0ABR8NVD2_9GAMM|nr:succinate dehydrogenase, hydrophobic membrane anchor protein [Marinomonas colpomeniae]MBD5770010.1 succinate dehydrogenase, hydrophobic membrane anchor protein [Marinomonas colpomeniae]